MKLYERHPARETIKELPETHEVLPELPHDVSIPDDVSGITHPVTAGGGRAASGIRWMRWVPAVLLVVAWAVVVGLAQRGDSTDTVALEPEPWITITEGPGSNSLAATQFAVPVPWVTVTEGPGSNSLAATRVAVPIPWVTVTEGPGSNSLAATRVAVPIPWVTVTEGPGSNSLAATRVAVPIPWVTVTEGPGSHTLAPTNMTVTAVPWTTPTEGPGSHSLAP